MIQDFETSCFTVKYMAVVVQERVTGKLVSVCFVLGLCLVEILAAFNMEPKHSYMASRTLSTSLPVSPDSS